METREQNKCLKLQVDTLKQKLKDAEGDIKVLRASSLQKKSHKPPAEVALAPTLHQREEMIEQLEKLNIKVYVRWYNFNRKCFMFYRLEPFDILYNMSF